ncbi:hypothetical protein BCR35DRAFT_276155, partial [Leucosporidium creatinivorum]
MSHMEDDFAATTTIGDRVAPPTPAPRKSTTGPRGPVFGVPPKLEPFTLLAKSARGASAAALISQACAAPGVYVFSELLSLPSIADLKNHEQHKASYELLEIFAYGTWGEYVEKQVSHSLPSLNKAQETKLKHLTILSLALSSRIIPYTHLLTSLSLPPTAIPALEDLLIEAFYANILKGRLDQREGRLQVLSSIGRDVRPAVTLPVPSAAEGEPMEVDAPAPEVSEGAGGAPSIAHLTASLTSWLSTIRTLLTSLETHLHSTAATSLAEAEAVQQQNAQIEKMVQEVAAKSGKGKGESGEGGGGGGWKEGIMGGVGKVLGSVSGGGAGGGEGDVEMDDGAGGGVGGKGGPKSPSNGGGGAGRQRKRGR